MNPMSLYLNLALSRTSSSSCNKFAWAAVDISAVVVASVKKRMLLQLQLLWLLLI
jgi:hypothetical protein